MASASSRLRRDFCARDTRVVARELLGKLVVVDHGAGVLRGRIVETEAYHGERDAASHAHRGKTARNAPMWGEPGHAYVYLIYGMWNCLNVSTMPEGFPAAVLVRALDFAGLAGLPRRAGAGPGKLCAALGIDRSFSGQDLIAGTRLWLEDDGVAPGRGEVARGPRVGVDYAGTWAARPWRFWWKGHAEVSR
jgi:DNA-3-methyladenine glycosylase